jgi:hypothetical protein
MQPPLAEVAQIHGNKINIRLGKDIISIWAACSSIFATSQKALIAVSLKTYAELVEKMC